MSTQEPATGSFWRLCRDLLAETYPDADKEWIHQQTARAVAAADRAVAEADRLAGTSRRQIRSALTESLGALRGQDFSPGHPAVEITTGAVTLIATARRAGPADLRDAATSWFMSRAAPVIVPLIAAASRTASWYAASLYAASLYAASRYAVTLRAESARLPVAELAGLWLVAKATGPQPARLPVRYLAEFDQEGIAEFPALPTGRWTFDVLAHSAPGAGAYPMPRVRTDVAAASTGAYAVAAPGGVLFVLHEPARETPTLEITAAVVRPQIIPIRYRDRAGAAREVLVAVAPGDTGPASSRADLAGFSPDDPWEAGHLLDAVALTALDAGLVSASVRASRDRAGVRAWQAVAEEVPELSGVISAALPRS